MTPTAADPAEHRPALLLIRHPLVRNRLQEVWEDAYLQAFRHNFVLTVVEQDCDLAELCQLYRPDLIAFRGAYSAPHRRITVTGIDACPEILRVGLYFGDGFCTTRAAFFHDMEQWRVEVFFTQTFYLREHMPEAADRLFVLPQTFDPTIFKDYGEAKVIPFIVFGELSPWRRWRMQTALALIGKYPTLLVPHPGYGTAAGNFFSLVGEDYARALNRALFSICDGSIFDCVLRKHVEIPASGAILISQPIAGLAEYGFVDMENCIIGEGDALFAKIDAVIADPDRLQSIARAGFALAQSRHAAPHADQLYRWFRLRRDLNPGQTIVQHGTFGRFEAVTDGRQGALCPFAPPINELARAITAAEQDYRQGDMPAAFAKVKEVLEAKNEFAPARLLLVRILLKSGFADQAVDNSLFLFSLAQQIYGAPEPDPVEWAWYVIALACRGELDRARLELARYPSQRHAELRRTAWLIDRLGGGTAALPDGRLLPTDRPSIAVQHIADFAVWLDDAREMLQNCGQVALLSQLSGVNLSPSNS